jgi:acetyl-CoA acyltransferase 1
MAGALKGIIERSKIDPSLVEDICVGEVLAPGGGATEMRAAALVAGFPDSTAVRTLNRQCSSGLQACVDVANQIRSGMIQVGIGAGVESMSLQYGYVPCAMSIFHYSMFPFSRKLHHAQCANYIKTPVPGQ